MTLTIERKKQIAAGLLFSVLATVIYYQFFASDGTSGPAAVRGVRTSSSSGAATAVLPQQGGAGGSRLAQGREPAVITDPLPLALLAGRGTPDGGAGRNIFVFPTPTPAPTPKPPPPTPTPVPPPFTITSINPMGRIARTGDFELSVMGARMPQDAKVFINGQSFPSAFLNEGQVKATITAAAIAQSGNLRVEVKSIGDASLFSNPLNLNVADPPVPPFLYVALIVDKNGVHTAIIKAQSDGRLINIHKGDSIDKWRFVGITNQKLDVLDTEYNISHILGFTGEGG